MFLFFPFSLPSLLSKPSLLSFLSKSNEKMSSGEYKKKVSSSGQASEWYSRGVKLTFTRGHISLEVAFKGPNVILGLYKYNYSLTRGKELGTAAG